jgi:hypothetical protein
MSPAKLTYDCSIDVLIAMGRESEMDEAELSRLREFDNSMTIERRQDFEKHINKLKKELQEKLQ